MLPICVYVCVCEREGLLIMYPTINPSLPRNNNGGIS